MYYLVLGLEGTPVNAQDLLLALSTQGSVLEELGTTWSARFPKEVGHMQDKCPSQSTVCLARNIFKKKTIGGGSGKSAFLHVVKS